MRWVMRLVSLFAFSLDNKIDGRLKHVIWSERLELCCSLAKMRRNCCTIRSASAWVGLVHGRSQSFTISSNVLKKVIVRSIHRERRLSDDNNFFQISTGKLNYLFYGNNFLYFISHFIYFCIFFIVFIFSCIIRWNRVLMLHEEDSVIFLLC